METSAAWVLVMTASLATSACRSMEARSEGDAGGSTTIDATTARPTAGLDSRERARLLEEIARQFDAHYLFPEVATRTATDLRDRAARGDFDGVDTAAELARVVTVALRESTHDLHAMLDFTPREAADAEDEAWRRLQARHRATAGFGATTRLADGIAHVVLDSFEEGDAARAVVSRRMSEISDASALVLDLRDNHGGDPETVALVASHLLDPRVHLNDMWWRDTGGTDEFWTAPIAGKSFGAKKPVFILTSKRTFSAGEELAYDLQCLGRAVVVGETTRGGAHPVSIISLSPVLSLRVPTGRAINPRTKTNWEGTGVKPEVAVDAADALRVALERARDALRSRRR